MSSSNLLRRINEVKLRKSEQKVARFVLAHPGEAVQLRIVDLARRAGVSEPTVVRFCRALECPGFQDFKLGLARELAGRETPEVYPIARGDPTSHLSDKVFDTTIGTLTRIRDEMDTNALEEAINALARARRVEFWAFGGSGPIATDAQHKFFRLEIASACHSDHHIQHMSAMSMEPEDVVVAISLTGASTALIRNCEIALKSAATLICICPGGSPLAKLASISLHLDAVEEDGVLRPLSSRLAYMLVIDILTIGVAQRRGAEVQIHLEELNESLRSLREPEKKS